MIKTSGACDPAGSKILQETKERVTPEGIASFKYKRNQNRVANAKIILKHIGLLFSCCFFLTGCSASSNSHMDKMLNEYICEENSPYRVGPNREVVLFVKHYIMVGEVEPDIDQRGPIGFTRTTQHRIPWENDRFALYRRQTTPALMQEVNDILYDNNTNIFLVNKTIGLRADDQFSPADFDQLANPQGHTRQAMREIAAEEPGYIHILYGWTSSTALIAAGDNLAVVVADDPRYGSRITSLDLAREIIHSLGYQPKVDKNAAHTLLHHETSGDSLSDDQIQNLWAVINNKDQILESISCTPQNRETVEIAKPANFDK